MGEPFATHNLNGAVTGRKSPDLTDAEADWRE
jgi:hypothetical protein